jgi:hypothetical protein
MLAPHAKALFARYSINLIVIASEAKQSIFQSRARAALQPARAQLGLAGGKLREGKVDCFVAIARQRRA